MRTCGLTVGKFMPFHIGHQYMIDFGLAVLGNMTVIVSGNEDDSIPLSVRYQWVFDHYKNNPNVIVEKHIDDIPMAETDQHGTVVNRDFWKQWIRVFKHFCPAATHFVSGDQYGQTAAEFLGIEWLPVTRRYGISGSRIRTDPIACYHDLTDVAKPYFCTKIAIIGAESTGKSTMAAEMSSVLNGQCVEEYGRTYSEVKQNVLNANDFNVICNGHQFNIDQAAKNGNLIISDTEAYTTYLFGHFFLDCDLQQIRQHGSEQHFDMYILLAPTVDWVDDGSRVVEQQKQREWFHKQLKSLLKQDQKPFVEITSTDFYSRTEHVCSTIRYAMENNNG